MTYSKYHFQLASCRNVARPRQTLEFNPVPTLQINISVWNKYEVFLIYDGNELAMRRYNYVFIPSTPSKHLQGRDVLNQYCVFDSSIFESKFESEPSISWDSESFGALVS